MNAQDWLYFILALVVGGAILFYVVQPSSGKIGRDPVQIVLETAPTVRIGESITVRIVVTNAEGKIVYFHAGEQTHSFSCTVNPCEFRQSIPFFKEGAHSLEVRVDNIRASKTVNVFSYTALCGDSTKEGECSTTKPLECVKAVLVPNCEACGCPTGKVCQSRECTPIPHHFSIEDIRFPSTIYPGKDTPITIVWRNDSNYETEGLFVVFLDAYNGQKEKVKETPQQIQLQKTGPNQLTQHTLHTSFDTQIKYVGARLYASTTQFDSGTLVGETNELAPLTIISDPTPPQPISNLAVVSTATGYQLTWTASPSSDVETYVVYQQNTATGGFTTYLVFGQTPFPPYDLPPSAQSLAYVVQAKDYAGNESSASQPVVVPAS